MEVDHYAILGLPNGVQGSKFSEKEIIKAYKLKALKLHPDKRRDDPNAAKKFQKLQNSYEILKDIKTRAVYDDLVRIKHEKGLQDLKRRTMMDDLKKRQLAAKKARDEEERKRQKMMAEIRTDRELAEKKARHEEKRKRRKMVAEDEKRKKIEEEMKRQEIMVYLKKIELEKKQVRHEIAKFLNDGQIGVEKGKMLKVSWDRIGEDYSVQRLRELFQEFGEVRYVFIRSCKINKGSAYIVMASEDAVVAATRSVVGDLDNPLLVLPVLKPGAVVFPIAQNM